MGEGRQIFIFFFCRFSRLFEVHAKVHEAPSLPAPLRLIFFTHLHVDDRPQEKARLAL